MYMIDRDGLYRVQPHVRVVNNPAVKGDQDTDFLIMKVRKDLDSGYLTHPVDPNDLGINIVYDNDSKAMLDTICGIGDFNGKAKKFTILSMDFESGMVMGALIDEDPDMPKIMTTLEPKRYVIPESFKFRSRTDTKGVYRHKKLNPLFGASNEDIDKWSFQMGVPTSDSIEVSGNMPVVFNINDDGESVSYYEINPMSKESLLSMSHHEYIMNPSRDALGNVSWSITKL